MLAARLTCLASTGAALILGGCGGFVAHCSGNSECDPQSYSYCNVGLGACFKRTGGETVPIIRSVVVSSATVTVSGDALPQSLVSVFLAKSCSSASLGGQTDTQSASTFS